MTVIPAQNEANNEITAAEANAQKMNLLTPC